MSKTLFFLELPNILVIYQSELLNPTAPAIINAGISKTPWSKIVRHTSYQEILFIKAEETTMPTIMPLAISQKTLMQPNEKNPKIIAKIEFKLFITSHMISNRDYYT